MYKYLQFSFFFFPPTEEKSLCVRFLACLSGLCLLALNTFGKHENEGEGCTLDPEDQGWGPVYACSRCCHAQWTPFLCVVWAAVTDLLRRWQWESLKHPLYSPNVSPCDYDLCAKVKEPLRGTRYNTRDELIHAIGWLICNINKDGLADGVWHLSNIW